MGKGTQPLLEDFSDLLHNAFEHNLFTCALFLDVSKAFDSVSHKVLLSKLYSLGFRGPFYTLLENFLSNRKQLVSICAIHSAKMSLGAGVPQGSILSPLLFNIYVNDLPQAVKFCKVFQYADDTVLLSSHIRYHEAIDLLQLDVTRVMDWFSHNVIRINAKKTQLICFRSPLKSVLLDKPLFLHASNCVSCNCVPVDYVNTTKYLGIHFDCDLSWNSHLSYIFKKLRAASCTLYNLRIFLPMSTRRLLVHALVYSILRYGITVFGQCTDQLASKVNTLLRGILRSVAYGSSLQQSDSLFNDLSLPTFRALFWQTVITRHYWDSTFKTPNNVCRVLRDPMPFTALRINTNFGKCIRLYYVPHIFNNLPSALIDVTSRGALKRQFRAFCSEK